MCPPIVKPLSTWYESQVMPIFAIIYYRYKKDKAAPMRKAFPCSLMALCHNRERLLQILQQGLRHDLGGGSQDRAVVEFSL